MKTTRRRGMKSLFFYLLRWIKPTRHPPVVLPDELIVEILSHLNGKSLMQLKCVSKSWNSIISDPFFVKMHLDKSSQIPHMMLFLSHVINNGIFVSFHIFPMRGFLENCPIEIFKYPLIELRCQHYIIGSVNGLVCLLNSSKNEIYTWNPATTGPLSENLVSYPLGFQHQKLYFRFSFGYDNLANKYKLVMFNSKEVRVYTFGDNVWKNIQCFPVYPFSSITGSVGDDGVYLSNTLNWFALLDNSIFYAEDLDVEQLGIISLDLGTETYTQFQFPREFDELPSLPPIVCNLMDSLCFYHYTREGCLVVWQMREFGVEKSWTKLLKFRYHSLCDCPQVILHLLPLHVYENGDLLILMLTTNVRELVRYNGRDNRVVGKTLLSNNMYLSSVIPYVDSLVSTF